MDFADWTGRSETAEDEIRPGPAAALAATLDWPARPWAAGDALPPLWHWLYAQPVHRASELGPDGHARLGGFLPPLPTSPLPRRMWAGGRLAFHAPLRIGQRVQRHSRIQQVRAKPGRSGPLVFVTVQHALHVEGAAVGEAPALVEEHDIVYRGAGALATARPAAHAAPAAEAGSAAAWSRTLVPDAVLLFRYSALTFNGHRIHYDRRWATESEGYPGLVVHGPLIATLLLDLLRQHQPQAGPGAGLRSFAFRALRPAFDGEPLTLCGLPAAAAEGPTVQLWAQDAAGVPLMQAQAVLDGGAAASGTSDGPATVPG
jgi:3-methylfumaryl-CoA hydratase